MAVSIHPSAVVEPTARLGDGVTVGPFCLVGPDVELAEGVTLLSHVVVTGRTSIGPRTRVFPFASIGHIPQDRKYQGEQSALSIGADNQIREYVTMNPGTEGGGMVTRIGDGCLFMACSHVAHDCQVGNNVVMVNSSGLAGHVIVGDYAIIGGLSAVHQYVRIGAHAMIGGMTGIEQDVIPFGLAMGDRGHLAGLNLIGLKRRGFEREEIHVLRNVFKMLFLDEDGELSQRIETVRATYDTYPAVNQLLDFIDSDSDRKILKAKLGDAA